MLLKASRKIKEGYFDIKKYHIDINKEIKI